MSRDLVCLSHLRWDFVYQRPNHLMARAAQDRRVFFVEEPVFGATAAPRLDLVDRDGVTVVTPHLPESYVENLVPGMRRLLDDLIRLEAIDDPILWYYTPMALSWSDHVARSVTVFDCMDHLAGFRDAPPDLLAREQRLLERADLVITGGAQLYEAKRTHHANVHCLPSSVDVAHFARARGGMSEPADQASIPGPRFGYCGVIDERIDVEMLGRVAAARPDWQFAMIGPVAKLRDDELPQGPNLHYLGLKRYEELPGYLAGWDVGIMPFARNAATRYISPTKTPEYLAAGLRVASTGIHDVVEPYGRAGLVEIGDGSEAFLAACERAIAADLPSHRERADVLLGRMSWDRTWAKVDDLIEDAARRRALQRRAIQSFRHAPTRGLRTVRPRPGTPAPATSPQPRSLPGGSLPSGASGSSTVATSRPGAVARTGAE